MQTLMHKGTPKSMRNLRFSPEGMSYSVPE